MADAVDGRQPAPHPVAGLPGTRGVRMLSFNTAEALAGRRPECMELDDVDETNPDQQQYALTYDAMKRANISPGELWMHYFSMGGGVDEYEVNAYLHGLIELPDHERDCISQAVNELFDDLCREQGAPYSSGHTRRCD